MEKYKEDFLLLLEAGFIAINQADEDSAIKLFKAAELLNPTSTFPKIGYGYLHLHKLELQKSIKCFQEVVKKEPENEMAQTLLGIALSMTPNQLFEGEKLLNTTLKSKDKLIKTLSNTALDFVDNFIKKSPSPAHVQKSKK